MGLPGNSITCHAFPSNSWRGVAQARVAIAEPTGKAGREAKLMVMRRLQEAPRVFLSYPSILLRTFDATPRHFHDLLCVGVCLTLGAWFYVAVLCRF